MELCLKNFLEGDWVRETCDNTADDDVISKLFKFRSVATNFIEGCPYFLIDHVFYGRIFKECHRLTSYQQSQLINGIALNGLIDMYCQTKEWFLLGPILKHSKKDYWLAAYLKNGNVKEALMLYTKLTPHLEVLVI